MNNAELKKLLSLFADTADEFEAKVHRDVKDDFRAYVKAKRKSGDAIIIKLAENAFTSPERIRIWERCADEYRKLGYYCPGFYADKRGKFPTVEFEGHRCVAWAEEYSKYQTAEELGISEDSYWRDAFIMTAKIASSKFDYADFPSAYCLFDVFCATDKMDEVLEDALMWKEYAHTLPDQFQEQISRIWARWEDNRKKAGTNIPPFTHVGFSGGLKFIKHSH